MGCDIHMYVEYKRKNEENSNWRDFGKRINPGRNYVMFGLLSKGVRSNLQTGIEAKGLPEDLGYFSNIDSYIFINDKYAETDDDYTTLETAERWSKSGNKIIKDEEGKPIKVEHPDWHSHSWLTTAEFKKQLEVYYNNPDWLKYPEPQYNALLASMIELEKFDLECRIVFWFDN